MFLHFLLASSARLTSFLRARGGRPLWLALALGLAIPATVAHAQIAGGVNAALSSNGATATSSSNFSGAFSPANALNGDRKGTNWNAGGVWVDGSKYIYPDWLQVNFNGTKTIGEIDVFSMQDNYLNPSAPTPTMTFFSHGLQAFQVQYWNGSGWLDVPGGNVTGNNLVWRKFTFAPISTDRIRVVVNKTYDGYSYIPEVEAWTTASTGSPPTAPDTAAPSVPAGLTGTALSGTQVKLTWNASTDNVAVTGYYVYLNDAPLTTTTATTFTHSGLTAGQTYKYRVSAFDAVPNHSAWTATPVSVTTPGAPTPDTQAPTVPGGLTGTALSSTQVKLTWSASTDNVAVTGYYVYLNDAPLTTTTATTYTHSGLTAGTTYNYRVSAFDAVPNHSAWTATPVSVTTPGGTPPAGGGTVSGKFIPTLQVYYGGGPVLTSADAARLAKFDLIDIDRFRYNNINGNTWAAIKAINPNVQIYLYQDGTEVNNTSDGTQQQFLNNVGRYGVSRGHPMGSLNGNNPGLFLLDSAGNRIYNQWFSNPGAGSYYYLLDFGSAAYQSYWVQSAKADIADQVWKADGIFTDICMTFPAAAGENALPAKYPNDAAWSTAMNSFSAGITAGVRAFGQKLWCNKGDTRSAAGTAAWQALDASATPPDVLMEEGAWAVAWGAAVQFYPEADWKRQVDIMGIMRNSKIALLSHTQLSPGGSGTDNYGKTVTYWQALWYSLGSFLLGKNDTLNNGYFMFYGAGEYSQIWWHTEYDLIDLGPAVGTYKVTTVAGNNIYWREFQKGYVYVNPTANAVASIALPASVRRLTHDTLTTSVAALPVVTSFGLGSHEAAIFLK